MNCTRCNRKDCRTMQTCKATAFDNEDIKNQYHHEQKIVQSAAQLVDNGRAGTLSRLDEIIAFAQTMQYSVLGLAYCYGMETEAALVRDRIKKAGISVEAVSCTVGGVSQKEVNQESQNKNVSCNPLGQAAQLNQAKPGLVITMGLCLGHDILFNRAIEADVTTLVVKDRVYNHAPLNALKNENN